MSVPRGELVFGEPWEAKAFAMTHLLHERGFFTWTEWTEALAARIAEQEAAGNSVSFYQQWLEALTCILENKGITSAAEVARWHTAWNRAFHRTSHGTPIEVRAEDFRN